MKYKLVCFDLDGTLTERDDSWLYIHKDLGVWEQAKKHRELFFKKKINYQDWADLDVGLWRGTPLERLMNVIEQIEVRPYIEEIVTELRKHNLKLLILSSGLSFFAEKIKTQYNFDYAFANAPTVGSDGCLTGEINVKIGYNDKDQVLQKFIKPLNIKLKECIAVADGENDIPLFKVVGLSIAFNPRSEEIAKSAMVAIRNGDLRDVLSIILSRLE
jgi:phosphoserine phosphatase